MYFFLERIKEKPTLCFPFYELCDPMWLKRYLLQRYPKDTTKVNKGVTKTMKILLSEKLRIV